MKKLCVITNKKIKWVEDLLADIYPKISILYSCVVYDRNCQSLRIREHDDGELYMFGNSLRTDVMDYIDCHEYYAEIPTGRYIYMNRQPVKDMRGILKDMTVIVMPDENDFESYLSIAMFLKTRNIDIARTIYCLRIGTTENIKKAKAILSGFGNKDASLPYFETDFASIFEKRKEEGFVSLFPISRDFRYLQAETRMNNNEFADYFGISVRNVENWRKDPESLKDFIYDLFEYKLLKEGII